MVPPLPPLSEAGLVGGVLQCPGLLIVAAVIAPAEVVMVQVGATEQLPPAVPWVAVPLL